MKSTLWNMHKQINAFFINQNIPPFILTSLLNVKFNSSYEDSKFKHFKVEVSFRDRNELDIFLTPMKLNNTPLI